MPRLVPPQVRKQYNHLRWEVGLPRTQAAHQAGVSYGWAIGADKQIPSSQKERMENKRVAQKQRGPIAREDLCPEAARALEDFEYFRRRYFGHISAPWQVEAAESMVALLASPHKEFLVLNVAPGSGKTALFSHDIPAWLTVRDRSIRGLIGSHNQRVAAMYTARLRRTFDRLDPVKAKDRDIQLGLACDAEATLAHDYGLFKDPDFPDIWTREQFMVVQADDAASAEKEPTWAAFGQDSSHIGWRVDYIVWDDVVTPTKLKSMEAIETQRHWWDDEAETRLEPTGVLVLQGQRLSSNDLYRYCLDKTVAPDDEDDEEEEAIRDKQYRHIIYKAHYEDRCEGIHKQSLAKPYPDGCLLDPKRLPWRDLRAVMTKGQKYQVVYQQQDVDPAEVLVPKLWVDGGRGADGIEYPGCWDKERDLGQIGDLTAPTYSVVTCDPSPTKFWSIQWWLYHKPTEQRFLMDHSRRVMDAPDFLDYDPTTNTYTGLLEDWWHMSNRKGHPFKHLIVEDNAAQRFMLQYRHFTLWASLRKVNIIPHSTHRNKLDERFGVVASLKPVWRHGRVRLPGKGMGRVASLKLIDEVTKWPDSQTDDCVMAQWFLEYHLPRITVPDRSKMPRLWRPSWMKDSA